MPRSWQTSSRTRKTTTPKIPGSGQLAVSNARARLQELEKKHAKILELVQKRQKELNHLLTEIEQMMRTVYEHAEPIYRQEVALNNEIHLLFQEILTKRSLGKKTHKDIDQFYQSLQWRGVIYEADKVTAEKEQSPADDEGDPQDFRNVRDDEPPVEGNLGEHHQGIRHTFLTLARNFHPDRAADEETKILHTELMKEINQAYREGDLAKLLELEKNHASFKPSGDSEADLRKECCRLEVQNDALDEQRKSLNDIVRRLKNSPPGAMYAEFKRIRKEGRDPFLIWKEKLLQEIKELEDLRDTVRDFRDKKMTIKRFLELAAESTPSLEQELLEMFAKRLGLDPEDLDGLVIVDL